jgi:hypothetical protein
MKAFTLVLHEFEYKDTLNTLLESEVYEHLSKEPTGKVQWTMDNGPISGPVPERHSLTPLQE